MKHAPNHIRHQLKQMEQWETPHKRKTGLYTGVLIFGVLAWIIYNTFYQ